MKMYRGNTHWLFQQLKRNWIEIFKTTDDMIPYSKFKEKIESGTEFMFAGDSYKLGKEISSTAYNHEPNANKFI